MSGFCHIKNNQLEYNVDEYCIILIYIMDYAISNSTNQCKTPRRNLRNVQDLYKENVKTFTMTDIKEG